MSAMLTMRRPSRRSLERMAMTPEEELELLIAEQRADDTYLIDRASGEISLDAPTPDGRAKMGDLVSLDEEGNLIIFPPLRVGSLRQTFSEQGPQHGTIYAYRRLRCRCTKCKKAQSGAMSDYRAKRKWEL